MPKRSLGTTLSIDSVLIGGLTNITSPERTAETIDTTTLDSTNGYKTFIQGFKDGGELSFTGMYDAALTGVAQIDTAYENGTENTYVITFPASIGVTVTMTGMVTALTLPGEANIDDPLGFEATIKVIGKPVFASTPSTGASAITFVQTDGVTALTAFAITPSFAIGSYFYSVSFTTQTSFKPKATAASHTIKLYVDNVYVEDLTSGNTGTGIAIGAAATKEVKFVVYEEGKTPKTYTFMVTRAS
jgi:predicted secreted protein